jgi:hypothetical protein
VFTPAGASAVRRLESAGTRVPGVVVEVDARAIADLRARKSTTLVVPVGATEEIVLELEAFDVFAPEAIVTSTGDQGVQRFSPDVTLYKGKVAGAEKSLVVMSFSPRGAIGVIEWNGRRLGLAPLAEADAPATAIPLHVIGDEDASAEHREFRCATEEILDSRHDLVPERLRDPSGFAPLGSARVWADLAVDCDWEYYSVRHGSNLVNAMNYATTLVGVVSAIYQTDINTSIRLSYLNVWTTSADPYSAANTETQLPQFQNYFENGHPEVPRHLAHLLSGRSLGGGIAYLSVLCERPRAYAVSQVDGFYSYPTTATTWDALVVAHEIGHNFSSGHTQSCFWQANGFAPPGALLDSCFASEGGCYGGPTCNIPANRGTIMSYCHVCFGGVNNTRLEFHDACKIVMRAHAEACALPEGAFDPAVDLTATAVGFTAMLDWSASPVSGVIRYDVYRSAFSLDYEAELVGSTTGTDFADPGRVGTFHYRVRAVRSGDQSVFSNEARVVACTQSGVDYYDSGPSSLSPVVADFDEDGIMDLVVANNVPAGTLSILTGQGSGGNGDGTFDTGMPFPAGNRPYAVAVADFDEDGILDLATANNAAAGAYTVLIGQGSGGVWSGGFEAPVGYTVGSLPVSIVARDFDENGITDLAVTSNGSASVSIALGQGVDGVGDGTFAAPVNLAVGSSPVALATADFNEDGILDLAVVRSLTGILSLWYGQGTGGRGNGAFTAGPTYSSGTNSAAITTGDFNEDGITDLAVARRDNPGIVAILLGQGAGGVGNGTFAARIDYPAGHFPAAIRAGDFNGDGITDLVVATAETPGTASYLFGRGASPVGDGTFEAPIASTVGSLPGGVTAGDFDEDGSADVAIAHTAHLVNVAVLLAGCTTLLSSDITVTTPNGGESWPATTERTIQWTRGPGVIAVTIEVSRDGGEVWETVAEDVTDTSFVWTVTDPPTTGPQARVRVRDSNVHGHADASDALFTIAPNPLTAAPPAVPRDLVVHRVFPNPAREALFVSFSLPAAQVATLELVDVAGRRVAAREVGALGAGDHVIDLGRGAALESGLYFVRLTQGARRSIARAAFVR